MAVCHMCRWVSIMPGMRMPPAASISAVPSGTARFGPTAAMRSPLTRTSAPSRTWWASSRVKTVAFRNTTDRPGARSAAVRLDVAVMNPPVRAALSRLLREPADDRLAERQALATHGFDGTAEIGVEPEGREDQDEHAADPVSPGGRAHHRDGQERHTHRAGTQDYRVDQREQQGDQE